MPENEERQTEISAMPAAICEWLSAQESLDDIIFLTEYPPAKKPTPLLAPMIAVGLEQVTLTDRFVENSQGVPERDEYCRSAKLTVRFSIYAPYSMGGVACHDAFTRVMDCLSFSSDLNVTRAGCENVRADRDAEAFTLKAVADIEADFCPAETSDVQYEAFLPKTFFCFSHINDADIHVTAQDKARWNEQTAVGTYFGTGSGTRTVNLGFRPKYALIFASGLPPLYSSGGVIGCYCGLGMSPYSSPGVTLTDTGFSVTNENNPNFGGTSINLNDAGVIYCYAAGR